MFGIGLTDIGKLRVTNQDFIYVCNENIACLDNLYIVADGIGGHNAGQIASEKAIEFFLDFLKDYSHVKDEDILDTLVSSVYYSNEQIYKMSKQKKEYENMGTTFLVVTIRNDKIFIVHIGDSRLYGIRNNKIARMTTDHTYAMDLFKAGAISKEEADRSKESSILTRALGTNKTIKVDALFCDVLPNDIFIMCSDGLNNMIYDEQIKDITIDETLTHQEKVKTLVDVANDNGGKDNIAVIMIK